MDEKSIGFAILALIVADIVILCVTIQCWIIVRLTRQYPELPRSKIILMSLKPFRKIPQVFPESTLERTLRRCATAMAFFGIAVFVIAKIAL